MEKIQISKTDRIYLIRVNFILSIMVVWHHAYNIDTFKLTENNAFFAKGLVFFENFLSIIQLVAVPMFFLISGYLLFVNYSWNKVIQKYRTRVKSLLIPYIVWNAIVFVFFYTLTHINYINKYINMTKIELSWYNLYRNIIFSDINSSMWFIRALIVLVIFSPLFFYGLNKSKKAGWVLVIISFVVYFFFPIGHHTSLFALPFFLLGGLLARHYPEKMFIHVKKRVSLIGLALFIFVVYIYIIFSAFDNIKLRHVLLLVEMSLFGIYISGLECLKSANTPPWFFRISFFIFCLHGMVLESIEKIIYISLGNNVMCAYVDYFLAPVLTLCIILIIAKFLSSKCVHIWKILNGNR